MLIKKLLTTNDAATLLLLLGGVFLTAGLTYVFPFLSVFTVGFGLFVFLLVYTFFLRTQRHLYANAAAAAGLARQTEAFQGLMSMIDLRAPLPPTGGWAASPDYLNVIVENLLRYRPRTVIECGSGVSTLITAYILEKIGGGKIYSLDHEQKFGQQTAELLQLHGLTDYAEVIYAPLTTHHIGDKTYQWYDLSRLPTTAPIDFITVDGPPITLQKNARYPALPLLSARCADRVCVVIDDFNRPDDAATGQMWLREFSYAALTEIATEKGTGVMILKR